MQHTMERRLAHSWVLPLTNCLFGLNVLICKSRHLKDICLASMHMEATVDYTLEDTFQNFFCVSKVSLLYAPLFLLQT